MNPLEKLTDSLCGLYESFGYRKYKMSKFEEYDLYAGNKDILESEGIITFTDTNGKLMALKPDVTLSILRNTREQAGLVSKVYYNENVYRISESSRVYKEIMQTGLECIGDIDDYCVLEVAVLAAKSLLEVSEDCILSVSLPGMISSAAEALGLSPEGKDKALKLIAEKNDHELAGLLGAAGADAAQAGRLMDLAALSGRPEEVIGSLEKLGADARDMTALKGLEEGFRKAGLYEMLRFDFSAECGTKYYSGVVFKGYVKGIPSAVLSGGRYDALARRMGKKYGAIGFALYTGLLERFKGISEAGDADTVIIYDDGVLPETVMGLAAKLTAAGERVLALRKLPEGISCRKVIDLREGGAGNV